MGYISILLLSFFISLGFSIFIIPRILLLSFKKHLFDMPDERKVHKGIIPRLGGVSFFPAVIFTLSLMIGLNRIYGEELFPSIIGVSDTSVLSFGLSSLLLLYLTGITDDLIGVRYRQKFIVQIFCAILLVSSGLWINNLYGIFGIYELPPVVGLPFTVFTIVFITNAINLIDGIRWTGFWIERNSIVIFYYIVYLSEGMAVCGSRYRNFGNNYSIFLL